MMLEIEQIEGRMDAPNSALSVRNQKGNLTENITFLLKPGVTYQATQTLHLSPLLPKARVRDAGLINEEPLLNRLNRFKRVKTNERTPPPRGTRLTR
jgi:hypothetical protein